MGDRLASAAAAGDIAGVEELLRGGAPVDGLNRFGRTPLQVMMMGSARVARLLLEAGARPNVADGGTGTTPLHDAARGGFLDTVHILVRFSADPGARDLWGRRPADLARELRYLDVAAFLDSL
ncbi:unnamed protein product [Merluccius merluccius]